MANMREEILTDRVYLKDDDGKPIEDYEGMCRRIASALDVSQHERRDRNLDPCGKKPTIYLGTIMGADHKEDAQ